MTHLSKISLVALLVGITSSGFAMAFNEADNAESRSMSVKPAAPAANTDNAANAGPAAATASAAPVVPITEAQLNTDDIVQPTPAPTASATATASAAAAAAPLVVEGNPKPLALPAVAPALASAAELAQGASPLQPQPAQGGSAKSAAKPSAAEDSKGAGASKPKAAKDDTMDFKASSAAAAARAQPPVADSGRLQTAVSNLPSWVKNFGKQPGEERSDERVVRNVNTEVTRFFECLANVTNGLGWKHNGRLEKERLAAAGATAAAPAVGSGAGSGGAPAGKKS
jgi:hypothetical protein